MTVKYDARVEESVLKWGWVRGGLQIRGGHQDCGWDATWRFCHRAACANHRLHQSSMEGVGDGVVEAERQWEEEKWHTGQCILMSIKRQHHDRRRAIKPEAVWLIARTEQHLLLPPPLCHSFSVFLYVVTLNDFPWATPWPRRALWFLGPPSRPKDEEQRYGYGLRMTHVNDSPSSWPPVTSPIRPIQKNQMTNLICVQPISSPPVNRKRIKKNQITSLCRV